MGRYVKRLTHGWLFSRGEIKNAQYNDCTFDKWQNIRVPHDYAIAGSFDPYNDGGNSYQNADGFPVASRAAGRTGALPIAGYA